MSATLAPTARRPLTATFPREFAYLVLGGISGIVGFTVVVTGLSTAAGLAVLVIGIPVAVAVIYIDRWLCDVDRHRARLIAGAPIPRPYQRRPEGEGFLRWSLTLFTDRSTWRDLAWLLAGFPVAIGGLIVAAVPVWGAGLAGYPLWAWALPENTNLWGGLFGQHGFDPEVLLAVPAGAALVVIGAWLVHWAAAGQLAMSRALLGPWREGQLTERIETLTETRQGAVDAAVGELQRVERDLHDGAQARLVALSIDLGMAEQKLASGDEEAARRHVAEARGQASTAMGELRDLVRGIGPSILRDRGLEAALTAVAAGRTPPVRVSVDLDPGEPDAAQTAIYFVCVEAIVNATKHAGASVIHVRIWRDVAGQLIAEISDDGQGGADLAHGTGLQGLAKRVAALDGSLTVTSPAGGPTVIRAVV